MNIDKSVQALLHGLQYKKLLENRIISIQEKYDLRKVDIEVLYFLAHCGEHNTARDIRADMNLTKGHISQSVDRLQKMGLVMQVPDKEDRRYIHLAPTEQAKTLMDEILDAWDSLNQSVFAGITEDEVQVLKTVAQKIKNNLEKELK
ncbi:MAG: winged helix-turn-helix transcriptional regulator [Eubacterium sp.]|nr:winged helix-turn-helix transcriptional regulator [Eubacterium sp.]